MAQTDQLVDEKNLPIFHCLATSAQFVKMAPISNSAKQIQAVVDAGNRYHLSVLNGPPGSGKQTLLTQAFPNLEVMMLETVVNESNVAKIIMLLQPTLVQGDAKRWFGLSNPPS